MNFKDGKHGQPSKDLNFFLQGIISLRYNCSNLVDSTKSKAAVEEVCNALAWVHSASGLPSLSPHPFVQATSEGLQRKLAKSVTKNKPVSVELLGKIVDEVTTLLSKMDQLRKETSL